MQGLLSRVFDEFVDGAWAQSPEFDHLPGIGDPCVPRHGFPPYTLERGGDGTRRAMHLRPCRLSVPSEVGGHVCVFELDFTTECQHCFSVSALHDPMR